MKMKIYLCAWYNDLKHISNGVLPPNDFPDTHTNSFNCLIMIYHKGSMTNIHIHQHNGL